MSQLVTGLGDGNDGGTAAAAVDWPSAGAGRVEEGQFLGLPRTWDLVLTD